MTVFGLMCGAATAHGAVTISDDFNRTTLGPSWTTHGGGTLYIDGDQLSAVGTPSEPVSMAFHNTPAVSATQEVSAVVRWNGRNPQHSAMSIALRADPASQHAGVHFWFTANLMGIAMLSWDGTTFTPATGTPAYNQIWQKWPDGTRITLKVDGTNYAAYVSTMPWMPVLWGSFTSAQVPLTNLYGGVHGQDDSAVSGGGEPPANLDGWRFNSK
ncbi:hypothetical protein [Nocardia otitidiscaviarum]|uniref:hypothetical protein n=1 Tax=Nocardia otitidiscaviarum TaxID=1823 RepID=UPI0011DCBCBC|nr:hypothetical protein [Nocardia otitidiscaviarum]